MVAKTTMLACSALTAMVMLAGPAAHAADSNGWWDNTSVNGRMYYDLSWIDQKDNLTGKKTSNSGYGFDVKRFYVGIDHKFNDVFSGNITTDINYFSDKGSVTSGPTSGASVKVDGGNRVYIYLKKAYLQAKVSDQMTLRFGAADMPWIPFAEGVYGMRYVENTLVDRQHFGNSSDWGVQALGKLANGHIGYDLAVVNGGGYKHPLHSKSMDFEGRVNLNVSNFVLGVGGYVGMLGKDTQGTTTHHTASRIDVIGGYVTKKIHAGVEYFYANNWNDVTSTTADKAEGYSIFGAYQFTPVWGAFARYDHTKPSKDIQPKLTDQYFNVGLQWSPTKIVDFSLVYKHDKKDDGSVKSVDMETNEVGVFSRFRW